MITWFWDNILLGPTINSLVVLSTLFLGNVGLAIILFTVLMRVATLPLTLRQLRSTRALTVLQPRMQEIQKKYKDPKRRSEETMKLYREAGVNPLGCLWPMLIQFPIWIALFQALRQLLGNTPESLVGLANRLYPWSYIKDAMPLQEQFFGMDLGQSNAIMPLFVGISTYIQQKLMTTPSADPKQQSMNNMMMWMMPLMFAWFTLAVPSGLALYWTTTNVIGFFLAYFVYGRRGLNWRQVLLPTPAAQAPPQQTAAQRPTPASVGAPRGESEATQQEKRPLHGRSRRRRKNRRRGRG
ncbi:MAG: YidC/Oxa1 family membrane protein insertase [Dehalococcoidia bacterium]